MAGRGTRERISGVRIRCRGFFVKSALDIAEGGGSRRINLAIDFQKVCDLITVVYQKSVLVCHRDYGAVLWQR